MIPAPSPLESEVIVHHNIPYAAWLRLSPEARRTYTDAFFREVGL